MKKKVRREGKWMKRGMNEKTRMNEKWPIAEKKKVLEKYIEWKTKKIQPPQKKQENRGMNEKENEWKVTDREGEWTQRRWSWRAMNEKKKKG